jgi:hypothetical protein
VSKGVHAAYLESDGAVEAESNKQKDVFVLGAVDVEEQHAQKVHQDNFNAGRNGLLLQEQVERANFGGLCEQLAAKY